MTFPFVQAKYDWTRSGKPPPTNKLFVNGLQKDRTDPPYFQKRAMWYEEITFAPPGQTWGEMLHASLKHIEDNDLPWIWVPEKPIKKEEDGTFKLNVSEGYLEDGVLRETIQFDIDHELKDSGWNSLRIEDRFDLLLESLPWLENVECIVQLSNKAFLPTYPDKLCLRVYVRLATPTSNYELRELFKAFRPTIDIAMFAAASVHLIQPPEIRGNVERKIYGDTLLHVKGTTLDLDRVRTTPDYLQSMGRDKQFAESIDGIKNWTADSEDYQVLIDLARSGYFYQNRHYLHYKILAEAEWVNQSGKEIAELLALDDGTDEGFDRGQKERLTIMGNNRSITDLTNMLKSIRDKNIKTFIRPIADRDFDYVANDPCEADLKDASLEDFYGWVDQALDKGKRVIGVIKSPHGSSKTTTICPTTERIVRRHIKKGKPLRYLYISTMKSIIKGHCPKLRLQCYTGDTDLPQREIIESADRLGICILSLQKTHGLEPWDLIIVDESEHVGLWSDWNNSNHNILVDVIANARCTLLMDADASDMTYSIMDRACTLHEAETTLVNNTVSWIGYQNQFLNVVKKKREVEALIADYAIDDDELCFVHTDQADKDGSTPLTTLVSLFNEIAGKEIAIKFDDKVPLKNRLDLYKDPNGTIEALYERGIRIIIISPIIISGWRYTGRYRFSKTFGIYEHDFFTAPSIIQKIQRVIEVTEHFIYLNPQSSYIPIKRLEEQIDQYSGLTLITKDGARDTNIIDRELDKVELKKEATLIKTTQLSNVKLHLLLQWDAWGGEIRLWEYCPADARDIEHFTTVLAEKREEEAEEEAWEILSDGEKLDALVSYFVDTTKQREEAPYGCEHIEEPKDTAAVRELLAIYKNDRLHYEDAIEITHILATDERQWARWSIMGAPWQTNTRQEIQDWSSTPTEFGYRIMGKLLHGIQGKLDLDIGESLLDWMALSKTPLVIEPATLDKQSIIELKENYKDLLGNRYKWFRKNMTASNFIATMFEKVFHFHVSKENRTGVSLPEAKARIRNYYMDKGWLPRLAKPPVKKYAQEINQRIKKKIINGIALDDEEQIYLEDSQALITITHPHIQTHRHYNLIREMQMNTIDRRLH